MDSFDYSVNIMLKLFFPFKQYLNDKSFFHHAEQAIFIFENSVLAIIKQYQW